MSRTILIRADPNSWERIRKTLPEINYPTNKEVIAELANVVDWRNEWKRKGISLFKFKGENR